jgi:glycolate oxidase iron-sulfur subunit
MKAGVVKVISLEHRNGAKNLPQYIRRLAPDEEKAQGVLLNCGSMRTPPTDPATPAPTIPLEPMARTQTPRKTSVHLDHERLMDCIHCGLCLSHCPTYAEEGLEADSPRGRIYLMRALAEGRAEPTPTLVSHLDKCLGCRACETACPSGVQYGHLIEGARAHLFEHYKRPVDQRLKSKLVELSFPYPNRMEAALLPIRILRRTGVLPLLRKLGILKLLGNLGDMEGLLPKLPPMRKRLQFPTTWRARGEEQARVGMITGCVMQVMQSPVNEATARVLSKAGCRVAAPQTQKCCGALHAHIGDIEKAKNFAKANIVCFETWQKEQGELDAIIINAAGCGAALKEYPGWFKGEAEWEDRARAFSEKVKDVSEFLAQPEFKARLQSLMKNRKPEKGNGKRETAARDVIPNTQGASTLQATSGNIQKTSNEKFAAASAESTAPESSCSRPESQASRLTYHDACHLAHGQGIRAQPRELLEICAGELNVEIVALGEAEMCCGSAGSYNITQPEMAMRLLERKMKHIARTGAQVVVTGNPGCAMQIMLGAQKFGPIVEVLHPVEVLDRATRD